MRLVEKGAVKESKNGSISLYEPLLSRQTARRNALRFLVNQAFDGAFGPLMHFLLEDQKLTARQRRQLLQAIQKQDSSEKESGK